MRDVTKTKPSHGAKPKAVAAARPTWPTTANGGVLATEVRDCPHINEDIKARLVREIIEYEEARGQCTQTFLRKVRKQLRGPEKK
jgi:hypothetical protein